MISQQNSTAEGEVTLPVFREETDRGKNRIASVDGLRGFACLLVVFFHCWCLAGKWTGPTLRLGSLHIVLSQGLDMGYSGVDLFFVLSGFCLAYPIVSRPKRPVDWLRFFRHRVRRIIPPYWAALILFGSLSWFITHYSLEPFASAGYLPYNENGRSLTKAFLLLTSTFIWSYWTLPLEWRWYFAFPVLVILRQRIRGFGVVLLALAISIGAHRVFRQGEQGYITGFWAGLPLYLPTFALGIWAAELVAEEPIRPFEKYLIRFARWGFLVWGIGVCIFSPQFYQPITRIGGWGILYFWLLLAALHDPTFRRFFASRPLVQIGIFSYSLYLTHEAVVRGAYAITKHWTWHPAAQFLFYESLVAMLCLCVGYLFFLVAEKPFLRHAPVNEQKRIG